jgi:hypothetical protein
MVAAVQQRWPRRRGNAPEPGTEDRALDAPPVCRAGGAGGGDEADPCVQQALASYRENSLGHALEQGIQTRALLPLGRPVPRWSCGGIAAHGA